MYALRSAWPLAAHASCNPRTFHYDMYNRNFQFLATVTKCAHALERPTRTHMWGAGRRRLARGLPATCLLAMGKCRAEGPTAARGDTRPRRSVGQEEHTPPAAATGPRPGPPQRPHPPPTYPHQHHAAQRLEYDRDDTRTRTRTEHPLYELSRFEEPNLKTSHPCRAPRAPNQSPSLRARVCVRVSPVAHT